MTRFLEAVAAKIERDSDTQVALITIGGIAAIVGICAFYFIKIAPNIPPSIP
jgi:hypothetical protein